MQKTDIERVVDALARGLAVGGAPSDASYIVSPMLVWTELQARRPDVVRHIKRYYGGDPFQQVKLWIPRRPG